MKMCDNGKQRNLFLLCVTKFLSGFAGYIYDIGIVIYLFQKTESVVVVGGFFVSQFLPAFIILMTGGIIDRYNKKILMILSNTAKAVLMLILLLNQGIWCIYIVTFLMNLILEFESSTVSALMVHVFPKEKLFKAASVVNFLESFYVLHRSCVSSGNQYAISLVWNWKCGRRCRNADCLLFHFA